MLACAKVSEWPLQKLALLFHNVYGLYTLTLAWKRIVFVYLLIGWPHGGWCGCRCREDDSAMRASGVWFDFRISVRNEKSRRIKLGLLALDCTVHWIHNSTKSINSINSGRREDVWEWNCIGMRTQHSRAYKSSRWRAARWDVLVCGNWAMAEAAFVWPLSSRLGIN